MNVSSIKVTVCGVFGMVGGAIARLFGGWTDDMVTLLIFMAADFAQIKKLLTKYGLYGKARCKAFGISILDDAYAAIGDGFYSYSLEFSDAFTQLNIDTMKNCSWYSKESFIECPGNKLTEQIAQYAIDNGVQIGIPSTSDIALMDRCIKLGASYITSDLPDGCQMIY